MRAFGMVNFEGSSMLAQILDWWFAVVMNANLLWGYANSALTRSLRDCTVGFSSRPNS